MRTIASLGQINEMRKSLNRLSRHLRLPDPILTAQPAADSAIRSATR